MACQVVPQTTTQIANSCQVRKRCMAEDAVHVEREGRPPCMPAASVQTDAFDDHRVHAEGEGAAEARIGAVLLRARRRPRGRRAGVGVDVGDRAARARLDELQAHRPVVGGEDDLVELVFVVRLEPGERRGSAGTAPSSPPQSPAIARRRLISPSEAVDATSSGKPSWNACSASIEPVQRCSRRRAHSGSKRTRRSCWPRKSLNHCAHSAPMSKAATDPPRPRPRRALRRDRCATCSASMPGARRISSSPFSAGARAPCAAARAG